MKRQPMRAQATNAGQAVQQAALLYREGRLDQAANLCSATLSSQPNHFEALQLLGIIRSRQGRNAEALQHIGAALKTRPADVAALSNFGLIQAKLRRLDEALASYDKALALKPDHAETLNNRASALTQLGRSEEALASCDKALAVRPQLVGAQVNRGNALRRLGRAAEAVASYDRALALKPDYAEAFNNRGGALRELGRFEEALASYDRALALGPGYAEAHNNRAMALRDLRRPAEALESCDRALALKPDYAEALNNRGVALRELMRPEEALTSYDRALRLEPDYAEALCNRANILTDLERPEEALASCEAALALKPDIADAFNAKGIALRMLGRLDEARGAIDKAIAIAPTRVVFYDNLVASGRMAPDDPHLRVMLAVAQDMPSLSESEQIALGFALGKALADIGDEEASFRHLLSANALKRRRTFYDEAAVLGFLERTKTAFATEMMRNNAGAGEPSCAPVFILGMPRSGTTLTEQILASHPEVFGAGEIPDFARAVAGFGAEGPLRSPEAALQVSREQWRQLGADYLGRIRTRAPTAARIVNKMPDNFRFVGLIRLALPNARIIHVRRDAVDTCLSCFSTQFGGNLPHTYDLAELGRYYRAYEALMAHWRSLSPPEVMLEVRYEEIVADLEGQARRIVDHCGLEWDARCLAFHETVRPVHTASVTQVRQPIYKNAVQRWRRYERFLGPLLAELRAPVDAACPTAPD